MQLENHCDHDIVLKIFSYLGPKDTANVSLVCKYFKDIADYWTQIFSGTSGIERGRVIPFLKEAFKFFPELKKERFSDYSRVVNFFNINMDVTLAGLDVGIQSPELVNVIIHALVTKNVAVDYFNLKKVINAPPALGQLLKTFTLESNYWGNNVVRKCHSNKETTVGVISFDKVVRNIIRKGSVESIKLVLQKFPINARHLLCVLKTKDFTKINFMAEYIDERIRCKDTALIKVFQLPETIIDVEMENSDADGNVEMKETSDDSTFGSLFKAIAKNDLATVEKCAARTWITPVHIDAARMENQEIKQLLDEYSKAQNR